MARTRSMQALARAMRIALFAKREGISTSEALERVAASEAARASRRRFLQGAGIAAAAVAARPALATPRANLDVGIVGAGLAGLACADRLLDAGVNATIYEGGTRVGGRQFSARGVFPGQVAERGGELIDNLHKTIIGYTQRFKLALEDVNKNPGEVTYFFGGEHVPESVVVDEYRAFVDEIRGDLQQSTGAPTADLHNDADVLLDRTTLQEYLESRGAGGILYKAIEESYEAEYGLNIDQQSSLNFLLFIHADKRSKFTPFGVWSDERYHVVDGNDAIATGLAQGKRIELDRKLVAAKKLSDGRIELTFVSGGRTITKRHDHVVFAIPFTTLRGVQLDASLGLPAWKKEAIALLGYGPNAKHMLGFRGRPWSALGASGAAYSDLADFQATWETNWTKAGATSVLTDYASGPRGETFSETKRVTLAEKFLTAADRVFPGAKAAALRDASGKPVSVIEAWPSNPLSRGSYTCYLPGQFTSVAGNEGKPIGNVHFAGEHANSFYVWQGFMEGAALSGIDAANELLG